MASPIGGHDARPASTIAGMADRRSLEPELLAAIAADAAAAAGVTAEEIRVVRVEPVTWRDGSLGCPQPGMYYTQALVPGHRVLLEVSGRRFDYRVGAGGRFRRCDRPAPVRPGDPVTDPRM